MYAYNYGLFRKHSFSFLHKYFHKYQYVPSAESRLYPFTLFLKNIPKSLFHCFSRIFAYLYLSIHTDAPTICISCSYGSLEHLRHCRVSSDAKSRHLSRYPQPHNGGDTNDCCMAHKIDSIYPTLYLNTY